jgi:hypothetical protein
MGIVDWRGPGHRGRRCVDDRLAALVVEFGPRGALDKLDEARAVALRLAGEATERGQHHTAAGLQAAAADLWDLTVELTGRFA